jgi:limonene-1,2-epoxide hydrolase
MNKAIVQRFFQFWCEGDIEGVLSLCHNDIVWDNVPMKPIHGREKVAQFLERFGGGMTERRYDVVGIMESENQVFLEAVENYVRDGKTVKVRFMSAFEFTDGLIKEWRDYFDLNTVNSQLNN